jgi:hypothetical protein
LSPSDIAQSATEAVRIKHENVTAGFDLSTESRGSSPACEPGDGRAAMGHDRGESSPETLAAIIASAALLYGCSDARDVNVKNTKFLSDPEAARVLQHAQISSTESELQISSHPTVALFQF